MATALSHGFAGAGRWLRKEFASALPVFLFFLIGFLLLTSLIKLALAQFSVEIAVLSKAVIGALFAAKATLVMDETPFARSLEQNRRILAVAAKTFLYGTAALLLGYVERVLEALHKVHNFDGAVRYVIDQASLYRILAWTLGISIVFALYFAFIEIGERLGDGALYALFFEPPNSAISSSRRSQSGALKRRS
jgi:hypothetical protein